MATGWLRGCDQVIVSSTFGAFVHSPEFSRNHAEFFVRHEVGYGSKRFRRARLRLKGQMTGFRCSARVLGALPPFRVTPLKTTRHTKTPDPCQLLMINMSTILRRGTWKHNLFVEQTDQMILNIYLQDKNKHLRTG